MAWGYTSPQQPVESRTCNPKWVGAQGAPRRLAAGWLLAGLAAIILCQFSASGCVYSGGSYHRMTHWSTGERTFSSWRNHVWAKRAFQLRHRNCDRDHTRHFRAGFIAGYSHVCEGGDGHVPVMPPDSYWSYHYQNPEGSDMVAAWFEGFPAGVRAAREDGAGTYRDVQLSPTFEAMLNQQVEWVRDEPLREEAVDPVPASSSVPRPAQSYSQASASQPPVVPVPVQVMPARFNVPMPWRMNNE